VTAPDAAYFDGWYADMIASVVLEEAKQRCLGLPPELRSTSAVTMPALREITSLLSLGPGSVVVDLACGRGGYGLWVARETGARVIGVDFSAVAIEQAAGAVRTFGLDDSRATFQVGALEATGLPDAGADAVMCLDAIQFAADITVAAAEIRRVLRPGGVAVVTCWEPADRAAGVLSPRLQRVDLAAQLGAGGLVDVEVIERADWHAAERGFMEAAAACEPGDDPALQSWHNEGVRVLPVFDQMRRVLATASAPS
jgi:SAM-dependent methyltransferase